MWRLDSRSHRSLYRRIICLMWYPRTHVWLAYLKCLFISVWSLVIVSPKPGGYRFGHKISTSTNASEIKWSTTYSVADVYLQSCLKGNENHRLGFLWDNFRTVVVWNAITRSFPQQRNEPGAFSRDFPPPESSFPMTSTCVRERFSALRAGNALMSKVQAMPATTGVLITATLSHKQTHIRDSKNMAGLIPVHVLKETPFTVCLTSFCGTHVHARQHHCTKI